MSSSIGPGLPANLVPLTSTPAGQTNSTGSTGAGTASSSPNVTPLYAGFPLSGPTTTGTLGLGLPRSSEDLAAILAEVSLALEKTFGGNRGEAALNAGARTREASGQIAAVLAAVNAAIGQKAAKTDEQNQAKASLATDQAASSTKQGEIDQISGSIATLTGKIDAERAKPADQRDQGKIDAWVSQRSGLQQNLQTAQDAKSAIDARITVTQGKIANLGAEIQGLQATIVSQSQLATQLQSAIMSVFTQLARKTQTGDLDNAPKDADRRESLERGFDEILDTLADFRAGEARVDADKLRVAGDLDAAAREKVYQAALGLATGLSEALAALAQVDPSLGVDPRDEALDDGLRYRIPV